jgi:glutamate dehydrogenase (NAD(P)+)
MPNQIITVKRRALGREIQYQVWKQDAPLGYLVIHSLFGGSSRGGIRMAPDISEEEVQILAEGMTLKFGLLGLPQGGAKAGIRADPDAPELEREAVLLEFLEALKPVLRQRTFVPGPDMGTSNEMVRRALLKLGVPIHARELQGTRSGYFTALSTFYGALHAADRIGLPLADARISIEGFGKVGSALAVLFASASASVVAISTSHGALLSPEGLPVEALARSYRKQGSKFVREYPAFLQPREKLFSVPVDILCPSARHNSISTERAGLFQARIVAPAANQPYDAAAEALMTSRGILCLPYWLTNCGGTLGETMEFAGLSDTEIAAFMDRRLRHHVQWLLDQHTVNGAQTLSEILKPRSLARHGLQSSPNSGALASVKQLGLSAYQRGWIPKRLMAPFSRRYFEDQVLLPFAGR